MCSVCVSIRDIFLTGTSDPYVKIRLGNQRHKSRIIDRNLNPVWNESYSFTTNSLDEHLKFKVYDHDWGSFDDFMGKAEIGLASLAATQELVISLSDHYVRCCAL